MMIPSIAYSHLKRRFWTQVLMLIRQSGDVPHREKQYTDRLAQAYRDDFEQFVHRYERPTLNLLWRMLGDEQSAYDLGQEVFIRA